VAQRMPVSTQEHSELGPVLKIRYPSRTDTYSMKYGRGHRTYAMVGGKRPITRSVKRATRPL
jgi:hypothetical protein